MLCLTGGGAQSEAAASGDDASASQDGVPANSALVSDMRGQVCFQLHIMGIGVHMGGGHQKIFNCVLPGSKETCVAQSDTLTWASFHNVCSACSALAPAHGYAVRQR